jgi:hypothetical protein
VREEIGLWVPQNRGRQPQAPAAQPAGTQPELPRGPGRAAIIHQGPQRPAPGAGWFSENWRVLRTMAGFGSCPVWDILPRGSPSHFPEEELPGPRPCLSVRLGPSVFATAPVAEVDTADGPRSLRPSWPWSSATLDEQTIGRSVDGNSACLVLRQHLGLQRRGFIVPGVDVGERLPVGSRTT